MKENSFRILLFYLWQTKNHLRRSKSYFFNFLCFNSRSLTTFCQSADSPTAREHVSVWPGGKPADPGCRNAAQTWPRKPWKCITHKHTYRKKLLHFSREVILERELKLIHHGTNHTAVLVVINERVTDKRKKARRLALQLQEFTHTHTQIVLLLLSLC